MPDKPTYTVDNLTRGTTLAFRLHLAGTSAERRRGLLARAPLEPGEALWIAPTEAIHTVGMKVPIDVLFLDARHRVRKISHHLPPWRIAFCLTAKSVLELPAGMLASTATLVGDLIVFRLHT